MNCITQYMCHEDNSVISNLTESSLVSSCLIVNLRFISFHRNRLPEDTVTATLLIFLRIYLIATMCFWSWWHLDLVNLVNLVNECPMFRFSSQRRSTKHMSPYKLIDCHDFQGSRFHSSAFSFQAILVYSVVWSGSQLQL